MRMIYLNLRGKLQFILNGAYKLAAGNLLGFYFYPLYNIYEHLIITLYMEFRKCLGVSRKILKYSLFILSSSTQYRSTTDPVARPLHLNTAHDLFSLNAFILSILVLIFLCKHAYIQAKICCVFYKELKTNTRQL